jgi:hypothetical protein
MRVVVTVVIAMVLSGGGNYNCVMIVAMSCWQWW